MYRGLQGCWRDRVAWTVAVGTHGWFYSSCSCLETLLTVLLQGLSHLDPLQSWDNCNIRHISFQELSLGYGSCLPYHPVTAAQRQLETQAEVATDLPVTLEWEGEGITSCLTPPGQGQRCHKSYCPVLLLHR